MSTHFERPRTETALKRVLREIDRLAQAGEHDEALSMCNRLIEDSATRTAGLRERAWVQEQIGDIQGAISDLRQLIEIVPREPADLNQLGVLELSCGNAREAIRSFSQAIEVGAEEDSHYYTNSSYLHRAVALLIAGNYVEAESDCARLPDGYGTYVTGVGMRSKEQIQAEIARATKRK